MMSAKNEGGSRPHPSPLPTKKKEIALPKTTGALGIREPHYNNINEFAVFVKVISEAIFSCGIIEAAQKQFTRALGLIWCRVSHFHDFF